MRAVNQAKSTRVDNRSETSAFAALLRGVDTTTTYGVGLALVLLLALVWVAFGGGAESVGRSALKTSTPIEVEGAHYADLESRPPAPTNKGSVRSESGRFM